MYYRSFSGSGTNWAQLADLATLEPTYFALLTNKEILAINQDTSPQATLVRQFPSKAQQSGAGAMLTNKTVPVTFQPCDLGLASQRWVPGVSKKERGMFSGWWVFFS